MCNLLVTALIIALLLIVRENVELNPGPMEKCPKCKKMMPTRFIVDVVICYAVLPRGFCTLVHSFCNELNRLINPFNALFLLGARLDSLASIRYILY